jgi:hypothetical protein
MKPGDLRIWDRSDTMGEETFVLLERVMLLNTTRAVQYGWSILEGGEVKERYEIAIEKFSKPSE